MQANPDMDDMANRLLLDFMDKEILEEPLKDAQESYKKLLLDQNLTPEQLKLYKGQQEIIEKILIELKNENYSKEKLVTLFEEMQELGDPPA